MSHYFDSWNDKFEQLKQYKSKHGDCKVPNKYDENQPLAKWVLRQRVKFTLSTLSEERFNMLNTIGFTWCVSKHKNWTDRFEDLKQYKSKHGDCNVPAKYEENQPLAYWVKRQRTQFKQSKLSEECINILNGIDFDWGVSKGVSQENKWIDKFEELKQYKSTHGDCNVSEFENQILARWVRHQRSYFQHSTLSEERINMLNAIGFNWYSVSDSFWIGKFEELKLYKSKHGDCNVPARKNKNQPLAKWVQTQRSFCRHSKLSEERVKMLNSIGFSWTLQKNMNETRQLKNHDEQIAIGTSYQYSKEKEKHLVNNEINTEKEDTELEENHVQIAIETSYQDSKEKETTTEEKVDSKPFKRSLQDRIQVLCEISIMFQEQKDAIHANMKRRKLGDSA